MKESKAVYVRKRDLKGELNRDYQFYPNQIIRDREISPDSIRYDQNTQEVGCQFDFKRDNLICTCKNLATLKKRQEVRYFGLPKQIYAYQGSRSYTDIGVGSVKALQRKKVKKIYLPETDNRGVGSSDLSSFVLRRNRQHRPNSYYENKKTSSKCVGGILEYNTGCVMNEKLSPIIQTISGSTSPKELKFNRNIEIGSNKVVKSLATITTQVEDIHKQENIIKPEVKIEEIKPVLVQNDIKDMRSKTVDSNIVPERNNPEAEKDFSSDSLVQHVHNLENPSDDKQSQFSAETADPMENKLEREYRRIFAAKSKSRDTRSSHEKHMSDIKSTSTLKRRFEALRRGLAKKEDSKRNSIIVNKISSKASAASRKDVSINSDPPSLEGRSYSSTKTYNPFPHAFSRDKSMYNPSLSHYRRSVSSKKERNSAQWSSRADDDDSECQGVKGMFKLWGKKFNLEEDNYKRRPTPKPSYAPSKKISEKKIVETPLVIKIEEKREEKKEGRKFFFFKKKNKEKAAKPFKTKKGVTAGRCEVKDGLVIKIGGGGNTYIPEDIIKEPETETENYEDIVRKAWLRKYLSQAIESRQSVQVRWNNDTYAPSSSTVFELMDNVYKDTGIIFKSKSQVTVHSSYKSYTKHHVNFMHQNIEAWMIPKTLTDRPKLPPVKFKCKSDEDRRENIEVRISDQKWFIDKSKAFSHKIEVVLHSKNFQKLNKAESSEYLRIDIPKGFFVDSSSDDNNKRPTNHSSDEEVYKIVEYETGSDLKDLKNDKPIPNFDIGDHKPNNIKVTVNVKENKDCNLKILETMIKTPPVHRDVVIQGSNVFIPKRCDVIGVGIITHQRDLRDIRKPILKILDDFSDDESEHNTLRSNQKKCEFAESYLQEYYRNWTPLGIDLYSWCVSDSRLRCCSDTSKGSFNNQGDGSKSCPNIIDDFQTSTIVSSCATSCSHCAQCTPKEPEKKQKCKWFGKFKKKSKDANKTDLNIRALPKDSIEVFKRRKIYAESARGAWKVATCPPSPEPCCAPPYSVPSNESKGCAPPDTLVECPKQKKSCCKPKEQKSKKRPCKKHVSLPDCETMNEQLAKLLATDAPASILAIKGEGGGGKSGGGGCEPCNKKKDTDKCPKHAKVNPEPSCEIPRPPCKDSCEKMKKPPCSDSKVSCDKPPSCPSSTSCPPSPPPCKKPPPCPPSPPPCKKPPPCPPSPPSCPPSPPPCKKKSSTCPPSPPPKKKSSTCPPSPPPKKKSSTCPPSPPPCKKPPPCPPSPPPCKKKPPCPPSPPSCPPSPPPCKKSPPPCKRKPSPPPPCPPSPPACKKPHPPPCPTPPCMKPSPPCPPSPPPSKKPCPTPPCSRKPPSCPPSPPPCKKPPRCPHSPPSCPHIPPCPSPPPPRPRTPPPCPHCPPCPSPPPPCPKPPPPCPSPPPPCPHTPPCPKPPPPCPKPPPPCPHSPPCPKPPPPCPHTPPCPKPPPPCPKPPPPCPRPPPPCPHSPPPCPHAPTPCPHAKPPCPHAKPPCPHSPPPCPHSPPKCPHSPPPCPHSPPPCPHSPPPRSRTPPPGPRTPPPCPYSPSRCPHPAPLCPRPPPPCPRPPPPCPHSPPSCPHSPPCPQPPPPPPRPKPPSCPHSPPCPPPPSCNLKGKPCPAAAQACPLSPPSCCAPDPNQCPAIPPPCKKASNSFSQKLPFFKKKTTCPASPPCKSGPCKLDYCKNLSCQPSSNQLPPPPSPCKKFSESVSYTSLHKMPDAPFYYSPIHPCPPEVEYKPSPCHTPPCALRHSNYKPEFECEDYQHQIPDDFPWPTKNQMSNQSSVTSLYQAETERHQQCKRDCPLMPQLSCDTIPSPKKECRSSCPNHQGSPQPPCFPEMQCPPPKPPSPPAEPVRSPPDVKCRSKSKVSGLFLKMNPSKKKTCSKDCLAWDTGSREDGCISLNSEEKITIRLKKQTPSTEEIREGLNIKVQDEDGMTLFERKDYRLHHAGLQRASLLGDMYRASEVRRVTTTDSAQAIIDKDARKEIVDGKSDASIANLIEIQFKLKVTQGDKTTEINIANDGDKDTEEVQKIDKEPINKIPQEVFVMKDNCERPVEHSDPKNDVNIRIVIKNFKPKSGKKKSVSVKRDDYSKDFSKKISAKFHTVSTGYSDVLHDDNVFSVHRATIDLTSSVDKSKTLSNKSEEIMSETLTDHGRRILVGSSEPSIFKCITDMSEGKSEDTELKSGLSQKDSVTKDNLEETDTEKLTDHKYEYTEETDNERPIKYDTEGTDTDRQVEPKYDTEETDTDKRLKYDTFISTDTDEHDTIPEHHTYNKSKSIEVIVKPHTKDEKKVMLKQVMEKAHSTNAKNKNRMRKLRDMLKVILTSDSSDHDDSKLLSKDLANDVTYTSLKPNYFRDSDSMNNYYRTESNAAISEGDINSKVVYPTEENNSECSNSVSDVMSSENEAPTRGCMCSTVAARLKMASRIGEGGGCCCAQKKGKKNEETSCDLKRESDYFQFDYKATEYVDVETQNSRYLTSKINSTNLSIHKSMRSSIYDSIKMENDVKTDSGVINVDDKHYNAMRKPVLAQVNHVKESDLKKLNRNTILSISDDDKIVFLSDKHTRDSAKDKKQCKNPIHVLHASDILQSYETKKAVLEIYTEKTVSDEGEHLVAKLPKFVYDRENEIQMNYEAMATNTYKSVCKRNIVMMAINR